MAAWRLDRLIKNVLAIAGSDPSGGAGIQADLKTFSAFGCYGMAVVTALTAQNTRGVSAIHLPPPRFVAEQIAMVLADVDVHAIKIGMLGSAEIAEAVANALAPRSGSIPIVLDPVLVATSGATLGDDATVAALKDSLLPLATIVTPNLPEAARLAGRDSPTTPEEIESCARMLRATSPAAWLLKGGHATGPSADDLLVDGDRATWFTGPRIATRNTHGTGCTLSSAIAACLATGHALAEAVGLAKDFLGKALTAADGLSVGKGAGPVDHFFASR